MVGSTMLDEIDRNIRHLQIKLAWDLRNERLAGAGIARLFSIAIF